MNPENTLNIFENTDYIFNRRETHSLVIDVECGTTVNFNVSLIEPLIVDKHSDVYLDSLSTFHCKTSDAKDEIGFLLSIDDFPIKTTSNNSLINRALYIPNEQTTVDSTTPSDGPSLGRSHKGKKLNYICTINPTKITKVSGKLTLIDGSSSPFDGADGRFVLDLAIIPR